MPEKYVIIEVNDLFNLEHYGLFETEIPFDFKKHSSIGCGGDAEVAFYPKTAEECCRLADLLQKDGVAYTVVGNLTNCLPAERVKRSLICTKKMTELRLLRDGRVFAEAGVSSGKLLSFARNENLSGAEFLAGVPCTLGGALYMNAGVRGRYIAEITESVLVYKKGEKVELSDAECAYAYKRSLFMQTEDIILGATLRLEKSERATILQREKEYLQKRAHLPKGKSMGCVFKNPNGISAGELIENAGLKGKKIGGAYISEEHANFIINDGNATPQDIRDLIVFIKETVLKQNGVLLEEEICYLG